jgi:hypothetical protein
MSFFDERDHAAGVLTSTLAKDVELLNGASSAGSAVYIESICAMLVGFAIGFY